MAVKIVQPLLVKKIGDIPWPTDITIGCIIRDQEVIIAHRSLEIQSRRSCYSVFDRSEKFCRNIHALLARDETKLVLGSSMENNQQILGLK
jgi:hypothetical protein